MELGLLLVLDLPQVLVVISEVEQVVVVTIKLSPQPFLKGKIKLVLDFLFIFFYYDSTVYFLRPSRYISDTSYLGIFIC